MIVKRLLAGGEASLAMLLLAGCGGINGSYSPSPASFFLPGLVQIPNGSPSIQSAITGQFSLTNRLELIQPYLSACAFPSP